MPAPIPTAIFRIIHADNLSVVLQRGGCHAPNYTPNDGLVYRPIHNVDVQANRHLRPVPCGPRGVVHDYVPFYFGYLSPMMLNLKTGRVDGYNEGQAPLIYLVATAQAVQISGAGFVFSDGHGLAGFTAWYDSLADLEKVDWGTVYLRYWRDTADDMDRQRRKQAEFMVHRFCPWPLITEIGVIDDALRAKVQQVFQRFPAPMRRPVSVRPDWYYH
jgi:hypothetical protein